MKRSALLLYAVASLCARANNEILPDSAYFAFGLDEVVVTGTRTAKSLKDTPVQTRLISQTDLRRADAANLQDILQQELPGAEFSYAMNQQVNLNLAGFSGLSVLVLVDGERLAGETVDNIDFSRLPMSNVERIEIIKGAASALYGSNAAGGVINIITKKPKRNCSFNIGFRAGSHDEWRADASIGLVNRRISNILDVNFNTIGSYDVCLDTSDDCDFRRVFACRSWNFSDRLQISLSDRLCLSARAGYYFKQRISNPDMPDRYRDFSGSAKCVWSISDNKNLELTYHFDQYDKSDFIRSLNLDIRDYSNVQHSFKALYTHALGNSDILTIGGDAMRDWLSSYQFADNEEHSQFIADLFAQYDANISDNFEIVAALRWDWYSDRQSQFVTPKINLRYRLDNITFRGAYSAGFRAPSLKEKYMQFDMADIFDIHGNQNLRPEKSHNFTLSAEYSWRNLYFMASGFFNIIKDKIATSGILYDLDRNPYIDYLNVENLRVAGFDASIKANWVCGISSSISYNFTHEDSHKGTLTQYCPARPHSLVVRTSWFRSWRDGVETSLSISGRILSGVKYNSMRMYEPFESFEISNPAYTLWKFQISQKIFNGADISLTIDNILNYKPKVYSFNTPVTTGTTLQLGLNLEIDKLWKK